MEIFISKSEAETIELGKELAKQLKPGDFVALYGDLGAGKTQFIKGVCEALKVREIVNSPTFTIANEYHGTITVFHIDLYRLSSVDEILGTGFDEYLESDGVCLVEWAEKLDGILPERRYDVKISLVDSTTREIMIAFIE
jgi:tRNA threonylcarbamoyladenosine biosynthesis protein TsaE